VVVSVPEVGRLPLHIVVPITDWKPYYASFPWFVFLPTTISNGLQKASGADTFQIKSVADARFVRRLGSLTDEEMDNLARAIALCVGYR
jgi:mRNA interferase MazF